MEGQVCQDLQRRRRDIFVVLVIRSSIDFVGPIFDFISTIFDFVGSPFKFLCGVVRIVCDVVPSQLVEQCGSSIFVIERELYQQRCSIVVLSPSILIVLGCIEHVISGTVQFFDRIQQLISICPRQHVLDCSTFHLKHRIDKQL